MVCCEKPAHFFDQNFLGRFFGPTSIKMRSFALWMLRMIEINIVLKANGLAGLTYKDRNQEGLNFFSFSRPETCKVFKTLQV
jgi:hypothetical protein